MRIVTSDKQKINEAADNLEKESYLSGTYYETISKETISFP
jgi:hypothetical protein